MRAEIERVHGRSYILRVYAAGQQSPAPFLVALVAIEQRRWWRRTALLVALASPERVTLGVCAAVEAALRREGFRRIVWHRWRDGVERVVVRELEG